MQEIRLQSTDAHILTSELAKRKHAVLLRPDAPSSKRQRTTGGIDFATCAREFAFTPDSPLSPGRTRSQVTAEEPAGPIEIIDLADAPVSSGPEADGTDAKTQSEPAASAPAVSSPALLEIEVFPDPVEPLLDPGPPASTRIEAVQHLGIVASAHQTIASNFLQHNESDAPPADPAGHVDAYPQSTVENDSTMGTSTSAPSATSQGTTVNTDHDTPPAVPQLRSPQLPSIDEQPEHSAPSALGSPDSEPDAFQLLHEVAAAANNQGQSAGAAAADSQAESAVAIAADTDQAQPPAALAINAEQAHSAPIVTSNAELAHSAADAADTEQVQSSEAAQSETGSPNPVTVLQLIHQGPYTVNAAQQQAVQANLTIYKKQVNDLLSQGRVSCNLLEH